MQFGASGWHGTIARAPVTAIAIVGRPTCPLAFHVCRLVDVCPTEDAVRVESMSMGHLVAVWSEHLSIS